MRDCVKILGKKPLFIAVLAAFVALNAASPALAQRVPASDLMPPPKAAPRTPVKTERLADNNTVKELKGIAQAIDGGMLRLDTVDGKSISVRLAGLIIAPLTDPKGIAARVALDELVAGHGVACTRRDRDTDGKLLATCTRDDGIDIAAQMLRDGITLFTRTGNLGDDYTRAYRAAEGEAQTARRGLWANVPSMAVGSRAGTVTTQRPAAQNVRPVIIEEPVTVPSAPVLNVPKQQLHVVAPVTQPVAQPVTQPTAKPAPQIAAQTAVQATPQAAQQPAQQPTMSTVPASAAFPSPTPATAWQSTRSSTPSKPMEVTANISTWFVVGMIAPLIIGFFLLDFWSRRRTRYDRELEAQYQRQMVAAALGGELAAARDVCDSRARSIGSGAPASWPRLRSYVYQTHVDKIGLLGPFLARQIASIYGQMADFATTTKHDAEAMNRQAMVKALQRLGSYIDVALEGLAEVEVTGDVYAPAIAADYRRQAASALAAAPAQKAVEARQQIVHRPVRPAQQPMQQHAQQPAQQYAYAQPAAQQPAAPAPRTVVAKQTAPRPVRSAKTYPTYGEVAAERAAQTIMEEEIIRARAEEMLKARSAMPTAAAAPKRRSVKPGPDTSRGEAYSNDTHQADLLGLDEDELDPPVTPMVNLPRTRGRKG